LGAKEVAKRLIDHLPDQTTMTDTMYELYVKQKIQAGLQVAKEGRTIPHDEIKRRFLSKRDRQSWRIFPRSGGGCQKPISQKPNTEFNFIATEIDL
jgi:predicted transcriptional regulator